MSKASAADALARMTRAASTPSPATRTPTPSADHAADVGTLPAAPGVEPRRPAGRVTRTTLDLDATRYSALRRFSAAHACKGAEVLRALLDELERDPALARTVADRLADDRSTLTLGGR